MTRSIIPPVRSGPPAALAARRPRLAALLAGLLLAGCALPGAAQERPAPAALAEPAQALSYADLMALASAAEVVLVARIEDQARVPAERATGLAAGDARLYLEAETETVLGGRTGVAGALAFLADRPLDARGRPQKLKKQRFLLFARPVPGQPGEIQLVSPDAMLPAEPMLVARTRTVLGQIAEGRALPQVTGVREVISVAGNLAGESETQLFLETARGEPVSMTVLRRPGVAPEWGVSWTEIVDPAARPPAPETLEWYRLACFLPQELPADSFLQDEPQARARAREDFAFMLGELGECGRSQG